MRIVAGEFRRRQLLTNPGLTTRPITDRAKVMLFDRIEERLPGRRVADFFSGTGSLGLEALSRGADRVVFAEQDHSAYDLLRQNVAKLGVEDRALCWRVNALRSSFKPKGDPPWFPYGVVFFDPPYSLTQHIRAGDVVHEALERLAAVDVTDPDGLIVVRMSREAMPVFPEAWRVAERLEISSMAMCLLEKASLGE
jgi:16S rRNA (guanine966-N2)-methyltransferase